MRVRCAMLGGTGIGGEKVGLMTRYLTRDRVAIAAAVMGPLALAALLLPWRGSWSNANVALLLVVVVVAIACLGNRFAGALAAISAAVWFDFFFTVPYDRLTISRSADLTTFVLLLAVGVAVSQMASWARHGWGDPAADRALHGRVAEVDAEEATGLSTRVDAGDDVSELAREPRDLRVLRNGVGGCEILVPVQQRLERHEGTFRSVLGITSSLQAARVNVSHPVEAIRPLEWRTTQAALDAHLR
jgi:hypothetical protein